MRRILKIISALIGTLILYISFYLFISNEEIPRGISGIEADKLAQKMMNAIDKKAFDTTEILEWNFRNKHQYKWKKQEGLVEVSWDKNKVILDLIDYSKSIGDNPKIIKDAFNFFNNDSFWLVAPYKVFDKGVERSIVKYQDKDALLVKYNSGGSTPGDSYLWILDSTYVPTSFKMWTKIIPIGGVSATWNDTRTCASGIKLPTNHILSMFGIKITMSEVRAYNPNSDILAHKILKAIKNDAFKSTQYIEWSFMDRRFYKWDKKNHIIDVSWNDARVILYKNELKKSTVYLKEKKVPYNESLVKRALKLFNNDSFWLVAPHKLFDKGVFRSIDYINGKEALRVKYPIDESIKKKSYVWVLDEKYIPNSCKMYINNSDIKVDTSTWENWTITSSGTYLPKNHTLADGRKLSMGNVKAYN